MMFMTFQQLPSIIWVKIYDKDGKLYYSTAPKEYVNEEAEKVDDVAIKAGERPTFNIKTTPGW